MAAEYAEVAATSQSCLCTHVSTQSIRSLRADLAAAVRRAGSGERIAVTVGGRQVAQLGPLDDPAPSVVIPPRRTSAWRPPTPVTVWTGVRIDRALADVR
jgi:antitoxin (DNA-binding transcriptional repressor) of toxin-antitoxin stability system